MRLENLALYGIYIYAHVDFSVLYKYYTCIIVNVCMHVSSGGFNINIHGIHVYSTLAEVIAV